MSGANPKVKKLDLLSVTEAAELLGKCDKTIYKWIAKGKIKALRIGGKGDYMIPRADLMAALEYTPTQPNQPEQ